MTTSVGFAYPLLYVVNIERVRQTDEAKLMGNRQKERPTSYSGGVEPSLRCACCLIRLKRACRSPLAILESSVSASVR